MSRGLTVWYHTIRALGKAHRVFIAARSRTRAAQVYTFGGHLSTEGLKEAHSTATGEGWAPAWIQDEGVWVERAAWPGEGWDAGRGYQQPARQEAFEKAKDMQDAVCILGDLHAAVMGRPPAPRAVPVYLKDIQAEASAQARVALDEDALEEYAEAMRAGVVFPPVVVFFDGDVYWLADGFHRLAAALEAGLEALDAEVHHGGLREAQLYAIGANTHHGIRRTNADKRRAVELLLADPEWSRWSDRAIAKCCGVSNVFVSKVRKEVLTVNTPPPAEVITVITPEPPRDPAKSSPESAESTPITTSAQVREIGREAMAQAKAEPEVEPEEYGPATEAEQVFGDLAEALNQAEVVQLRQQVAELQAQLDEMHQLIRDGQADAEAVARILEADDHVAQALAEIKRANALTRTVEQQLKQIQGRAAFLGSEAEKWKRIAEKAQPRKEKRQATPKNPTLEQAESDAIPTESAWD